MLKKLISILLVCTALVLVALFLDNSVFVVKNVRVEGESGMEETDVMRLAHINMGGKMRRIDIGSMRRSVESSGALKCISIEKELPSTLVITVERRVPRMVVDYGGSVALIDAQGYVISVTREMPEGDYLYVTGLSPKDAVPGRMIGTDNLRIDAVCKVIAAIDATGTQEYVSEINASEVDNIYLYSRTGIQVVLGDSTDLDSKLIWMKYALIDLESRGNVAGKLDVTGGKQADFSEY